MTSEDDFRVWTNDPRYLRQRFARILREQGVEGLIEEYERRHRREGGSRWHMRAKMQSGGGCSLK
jgi:hypothetical protein